MRRYPAHLFGGYGPPSWELADPVSVKPVLHDNPCQVGRKSPRRRVRSDFSGPEARGDCRNSSIADYTPAFGLSCPLRHLVPTGMYLNSGVYRRTGDVLVDLHGRESTGTSQCFWNFVDRERVSPFLFQKKGRRHRNRPTFPQGLKILQIGTVQRTGTFSGVSNGLGELPRQSAC